MTKCEYGLLKLEQISALDPNHFNEPDPELMDEPDPEPPPCKMRRIGDIVAEPETEPEPYDEPPDISDQGMLDLLRLLDSDREP